MAITIHIEDQINGNPSNGKVGHIGYTAIEGGWQSDSGWVGCPLGRGTTKDGAVRDLLRRANQESGTSYTLEDLTVVDRSNGPK